MLGARVKTIAYSDDGVSVSLVDGTMLKADYALVSFSLGVLQHTDVTWEPKLPAWKAEAICSMNMVSGPPLLRVICLSCSTQGTCSKIFMQFPRKFWFDTEVRTPINHSRITLLKVSIDRRLRRPFSREVPRLAESRPRQLLPWVWCALCHRYCVSVLLRLRAILTAATHRATGLGALSRCPIRKSKRN